MSDRFEHMQASTCVYIQLYTMVHDKNVIAMLIMPIIYSNYMCMVIKLDSMAFVCTTCSQNYAAIVHMIHVEQ